MEDELVKLANTIAELLESSSTLPTFILDAPVELSEQEEKELSEWLDNRTLTYNPIS